MGEPLRWGGLNLTGLRRRHAGPGGAEDGVAAVLDAFYRRLYADEAEALAWMRAQPGFEAEKAALGEFCANRKRALLRKRLSTSA
jgi:hypothetical protein